MHYFVGDEPANQLNHMPKRGRDHNRFLGFGFLVLFLVLVGKIWVPYAMAAVHATAVVVLPPSWAQSYIAATLPKTAETASENKLTITTNDLHIEAPIVEGIDSESLIRGVGHDPKSSKPGEQGRFILSGHRFWPSSSPWATVFFSLDKLKVNDKIEVRYNGKTYRYHVAETWNVPKDDAHPRLAATSVPTLTIYTCGPTPYSSKNRLGFNAVLDESSLRQDAGAVLGTFQEGVME
jgi:LPXTG-site transpeptidase (sortase) family protein